jgi:hypothetical protein
MKRRAIAILALSLLARTPVAAQTAPVIDGQNGTVTISAQTLDWFRQRLAEEEQRLRQLQVTVQQIARALANNNNTPPTLSAVPSQPAAQDGSPIPGATTGTARPATQPSPWAEVPAPTSPNTAASPAQQAPNAGAPKPGTRRQNPGPRIAIPTWAPAAPYAPPTARPPVVPDVSGSPVPIEPGMDDADPVEGAEASAGGRGTQALVTTDPALLPLAAPLRLGLTQEEARRIKGTPALISRSEQAGIETWSYPDGSMTFQGGRLTTWRLQSVPPPMEPVARRAPRAMPAEDRLAMGPTDREIEIPADTGASPPQPAGKVAVREKAAVEKVAPSRTTTQRVRRGSRRHHRSTWRHRRHHHRYAWSRHRHARYAWSARHRHRWAKGTVRTVGRHAAAHTNCRLCRMARAHLRSDHRVVMTEVAGWRARAGSAAASKVRAQPRNWRPSVETASRKAQSPPSRTEGHGL